MDIGRHFLPRFGQHRYVDEFKRIISTELELAKDVQIYKLHVGVTKC